MSTHRNRRRSVRLRLPSTTVRAVLALGVVLMVGVTGTWAYWSDSSTVSGLSVTTGKIDIKVNGSDDVTGYTQLNATGLVPGNSTAAILTVSNAGSVPFTYTGTSTVTGGTSTALGSALATQVRVGGTVTGTGNARTCTGGSLLTDTGSLNGPVISTARTLATGASDSLCLQVSLPTSAASTLQGLTVTAQLAFTATQA